jgi:hypothetical protein
MASFLSLSLYLIFFFFFASLVSQFVPSSLRAGWKERKRKRDTTEKMKEIKQIRILWERGVGERSGDL